MPRSLLEEGEKGAQKAGKLNNQAKEREFARKVWLISLMHL
jgi:hypothetical protein